MIAQPNLFSLFTFYKKIVTLTLVVRFVTTGRDNPFVE